MNKLRVTLPKKWLTFDEIKDKVAYPTSQNKIEQLEKYIEVKEQECDDLQDRIDFLIDKNDEKQEVIDKAIEYIKECTSSPDKYERFISTGECKKLLDILKGDNNE